MNWLNENAGAVQVIATVLLIVVTGAYVWLTGSLADATRNEVAATLEEVEVTRRLVAVATEQAEASRQQAESTARLVETSISQAQASQAIADESRRARALAYLPLVVPRFAGSTGNRVDVEITNHGSGAALEVKVQWFARAPAIVGSGGLLDFTPSLGPGSSVEREVVIDGAEPLRVLAQFGGRNFTYNCEYKDINGAHYQAQVRGNEFDLVALNDQARFALARDQE